MATQNERVIKKDPPPQSDEGVALTFREQTSLPARIRRERFQAKMTPQERNRRVAGRRLAQAIPKRYRKKIYKKVLKKGVVRALGPALLYISGFISIIIAIFSILGLVIFTKKDSWFGFFESDVVQIASTVTFVSMLIAFASYLCFLLFFSVLKVNPLKSTMGMAATIFLMAFDMLPGVQIFPWLFFWILILTYTPLET